MEPKMIERLLLDSGSKRTDYVQKNRLDAWRLYNQEQPEIAIAIDIYQKDAVIHLFETLDKKSIQAIEAALKKIYNVSLIFYKDRTKSKAVTNAVLSPKKEIIVREYGNKFLINLSDYLDTGLFLDHRETRKWIREQSKNKKVLNTFAYTGSFSIYAAQGGASMTHSVDLSRHYCDWIRKNFELNQMAPEHHWIYKMDTLEYFKYAKKKQLAFDIIIIDPPTFSRNKGQYFSVQKDHPELIKSALEILDPKGFILFSNNCQNFVFNKRELKGYYGEEKKDTIPEDFSGSQPHRCFIISR